MALDELIFLSVFFLTLVTVGFILTLILMVIWRLICSIFGW
jgi:hypothetical protein